MTDLGCWLPISARNTRESPSVLSTERPREVKNAALPAANSLPSSKSARTPPPGTELKLTGWRRERPLSCAWRTIPLARG